MNMMESGDQERSAPEWKQLSSIQRRVCGVLVEKSKTTPDIYPMTVNAIRTGANQKSNRSPQMTLDNDRVENTLHDLRELGAVIEVMGDGRAPKFKHCLYEWFAVDRAELAVMAELLLRGEQTMGDLRARAARMEKIAGLNELKPIVEALISRNLVIELTPKGRGQVVTHNLYLDNELAALKSKFTGASATSDRAKPVVNHASSIPAVSAEDSGDLRQLLEALTRRVEKLESQIREVGGQGQ